MDEIVITPGSVFGLPDKEITIAEYLNNKRYSTACIGKWHLGSVEGSMPNDHGFDYFYGVLFSNDISESNDIFNSKEYYLPIMNKEILLNLTLISRR